jgi:hypothetical protein
MISGAGSNEILQESLSACQVTSTDYEGPTSILSLVAEHALHEGIETFNLIVHLPGYLAPDEDYRGMRRLLEVLRLFYDVPLSAEDTQKAQEQEEQFRATAEQFLEQQPQLKFVLKQLEDNYDARVKRDGEEISLAPEVEKFLKDLDWRLGQG